MVLTGVEKMRNSTKREGVSFSHKWLQLTKHMRETYGTSLLHFAVELYYFSDGHFERVACLMRRIVWLKTAIGQPEIHVGEVLF